MPKSDTSVWVAIRKAVDEAGKLSVRVGVLSSQGGDAKTEDGISMIELAAIHEFGAPRANIRERSFIRSTFTVFRAAELADLQTKLARAIVTKGWSVRKALGVIGVQGVAWVKRSISDRLIVQDLAPATIARKNRTAKDQSDATTALVDTGRLINAIQSEIVASTPGSGS